MRRDSFEEGEIILKTIYEDNHVIAVIKPFGIPSQSDKTGDLDVYSQVLEYISINNKSPYLGMIQRLDRPVGGIMLFCKTKYAAQKLTNEKNFTKKYYGIVCGLPEKEEGEFINYIVKNERMNISKIVNENEKYAKLARLSYRLLNNKKADNETLSLLEVVLHTGRHHQIRVQMSHAGYPLWGDTKYNDDFKRKAGFWQIALWAGEISFTHIKTGKMVYLRESCPNIYPFTIF